MPADGQQHPTNPNLIWDADAKGYVSVSGGGGGGTAPNTTQVGDTVQLWNNNSGGWITVRSDDLRVGDIIWNPVGGLPIRVMGEDPYVPGKFSYSELAEWEYELLQGGGGGGLPGSGSGSQSYGSTQQSQSQAEAAQLEQIKLQNQLAADRERELARIQAENQRRNTLLEQAGSLTRSIAELKSQGRNMISSLQGVDPVRQGIVASGGVQRGTTPAQAFRTDLQSFVEAPVPTFNAEMDIPTLEGTVGSLQGMAEKDVPDMPKIGFAGGGYADQGGIRFGNEKRAIMLGEGQMNGDEEVGIFDPSVGGITEVIPLAGGAAEGASFDTTGLRQALGGIYSRLGFGGRGPEVERGKFGFSYGSGGAKTAQQLGFRPRLIRDAGSGQAYFKDTAGMLRPITSQEMFDKSGFRWDDFLNVNANELGQFGRVGSALSEPPPLIEPQAGKYRYGTPAQPYTARIEGKDEIPLPSMQMIASIWNRLNPAVKQNVASAFGVGGLGSIEQAIAALDDVSSFYTPVGSGGRVASFG